MAEDQPSPEKRENPQTISWRNLTRFVAESNAIESITRRPTDEEVQVHREFLGADSIKVANMVLFVRAIAGAPLRLRPDMNVTVGSREPVQGGPHVAEALHSILLAADTRGSCPYQIHHEYERLHPFMDGNGRSGRALWLRMMLHRKLYVPDQLFLRNWYYFSLNDR